MTSSENTSRQNPNDIFWLARYAHNQTASLFEQAKAVEPSTDFRINIEFCDVATVYKGNHIGINSHWNRKEPLMFQQSTWLYTKADVDRFAAKLAADVFKLEAVTA
ncbi:MAG TPA: hypothetical protein VIM08_03800 [Arthrobacter sp.]|jgi:hypothetical protein